MQTRNPFFDDLARLASGAIGTAQTVREEMETLLRARLERWAADMAFATREEVDAAMAAATAAEERIAALSARVAALEAALADAQAPTGSGGQRPARRRVPSQPGMLRPALRRRRPSRGAG